MTAVFLIGFGLVILAISFRVWQLQASIDKFHAYWDNLAQLSPPENALWYVALGDSAAVGIGASHPEKSYVGLLAAGLAEKYDRPVHVINLAKSGAKLNDVLEKQLPKFQNLDIPKETVVTIDIGSNNMRGFTPEVFARDFEEILKRLPPQTVVADIPYFGPDSHRHGGKQARAANEIIRPLINKYGLRHAQLFEHTKNNKSLGYYAADFFHPSDKGYRSWFRAFIDLLNSPNNNKQG